MWNRSVMQRLGLRPGAGGDALTPWGTYAENRKASAEKTQRTEGFHYFPCIVPADMIQPLISRRSQPAPYILGHVDTAIAGLPERGGFFFPTTAKDADHDHFH